jgi:hypothetical protein
MPNGTLDGFNHIPDFDEGLTDVFRVSAILFLRQSSRDVAAVRNLSISCCDQLLNVFVILSHSGGLLLINLFAHQLRQLGDVHSNAARLITSVNQHRHLWHIHSAAQELSETWDLHVFSHSEFGLGEDGQGRDA